MKMDHVRASDSVTADGHIDPASGDYQVLMQAISSCAGQAVQQLVKINPKLVNTKGWHGQTPMHKACLGADWAVISILLEAGADPNAPNDYDETPLHFACKRGNLAAVHLLAQHGGNLSAVDREGKGMMHHTAQTGSVYCLHYLGLTGANFRDCDIHGQTPLHIVCQFGHLEAFEYLLRKERCDPAQPDNIGNTPLHITAQHGYCFGSWALMGRQTCSALHVKNKAGFTPTDLARQSDRAQHKEIIPMLTQYSEERYRGQKPQGPVLTWYWCLMMPAVLYGLVVLATSLMGDKYQGVVVLVGVGFLMWSIYKQKYRLAHVSRWPNPVYTGMFAAGVFHTLLVYYVVICPHITENRLLLYSSIIITLTGLYFYWKVLTVDPGEVKESVSHPNSHQPKTILDVTSPGGKSDLFCTDCEIVRSKRTKHCRLCNRCYYNMDHHCLFLYSCVAHKNHVRFLRFILFTVCCIVAFLLCVVLYCKTLYPAMTFGEVVGEMFHSQGWVSSMALMNVASLIWAINLLRFQLNVISTGGTTYFLQNDTTLTTVERWLNAIYFLRGKEPFAKDPLLSV